MKFLLYNPSNIEEIKQLFTKVFSASEGEMEGQLIGDLVSNLITTTEPEDLIGFIASSNGDILGCIFF